MDCLTITRSAIEPPIFSRRLWWALMVAVVLKTHAASVCDNAGNAFFAFAVHQILANVFCIAFALKCPTVGILRISTVCLFLYEKQSLSVSFSISLLMIYEAQDHGSHPIYDV